MIARTNPAEATRDLEAERILLCCLILKSELLVQLDDITPQDFYDTHHAELFNALQLMQAADVPVEPVSIKRQLVAMGCEFDAGYLGKIANSKATAANIDAYASTVRSLSRRRQVLQLSAEINTQAMDPTQPLDEIAAHARKFIEVMETRADNNRPRSVADVMQDLVDEMSLKNHEPGIPTGYVGIDETFGRLQRSELTTLGARPGGGKTTLGMEIATYNASRDRRVLYVSLEMGELEFAKRLACLELGIDSRLMRQGNLADTTKRQIQQLATEYASGCGYPFLLWAPPRATHLQIEARARYQHATGGLDLLIVDHLQIVRHPDNKAQRYQQLGDITASLKALAKELNIPVLLQSQIARKEETPTLSSLRESGDIEQNSDNVWFLHREANQPEVEFIVAKFRHGVTGELCGESAFTFGDGGRLEDPAPPKPYAEFATA